MNSTTKKSLWIDSVLGWMLCLLGFIAVALALLAISAARGSALSLATSDVSVTVETGFATSSTGGGGAVPQGQAFIALLISGGLVLLICGIGVMRKSVWSYSGAILVTAVIAISSFMSADPKAGTIAASIFALASVRLFTILQRNSDSSDIQGGCEDHED